MWITTNILKPFIMFDVNGKTRINLVEKSKGYIFKNPKFIYGIKKLLSPTNEWDSKINIIKVSDNIYDIFMDDKVSNNIEIVFVVYDDIIDESNASVSSTGTWTTYSSIKRVKSFLLTPANNYTVSYNLPQGEKIHIVPLVKYMITNKIFMGYKIDIQYYNNFIKCNVWGYSSFTPYTKIERAGSGTLTIPKGYDAVRIIGSAKNTISGMDVIYGKGQLFIDNVNYSFTGYISEDILIDKSKDCVIQYNLNKIEVTPLKIKETLLDESEIIALCFFE